MNNYLAAIDRQHLENSVFLTSLAKSLANQGHRKGIIIHGDSEYTDRLIQTGIMREEAEIRAIKDLNRRLVALFADNGVATIGLNGFQKGLIKKKEGKLSLDQEQLSSLPDTPVLLISNLVESDQGDPLKVPLPELMEFLYGELSDHQSVLFSMNEKHELLGTQDADLHWSSMDEEQLSGLIPVEFHRYRKKVIVLSSSSFGQWPDFKSSTRIR